MKTFAKAPLALAIAALLAAPYALATGSGSSNDFDTDSSIDSEWENEIEVEIEHEIEFEASIEIEDEFGIRDPNNYAAATIDRKQLSNDNTVSTDKTDNDAVISGGAASGASGNVGINVASGSLNMQANDTSLAKGTTTEEEITTSTTTTTEEWKSHHGYWYKDKVTVEETVTSDEAMVFAKAATFSVQSSSDNTYYSDGTNNNAVLNGGSLANAKGNVGVNVAAGAGNAQSNGMALAVGTNSSADATSGGLQVSYDNLADEDLVVYGSHHGPYHVVTNVNNASLSGGALAGAAGNIGANIASGNGNMQSNTLSIAYSK